MPQQVRAVVVDPAVPGKLAIKPVELRDPDRDEVAVRVTAISLNRGETRRALQQAEPGWRPGWDFVGVAETAAADGSGPKTRHARGRNPAVGRLGRAAQLPQPCGRHVTRSGRRCRGSDVAGRGPHRTARAAAGRAAARAQGAGRRRLRRGRASRVPARYCGRRRSLGPCAPRGISRRRCRMVRRTGRARPRARRCQAARAVLADPRLARRLCAWRGARHAAAGRHLRYLRGIRGHSHDL